MKWNLNTFLPAVTAVVTALLFVGCEKEKTEPTPPTPTPEKVAVTGVSLNKTTLSLVEGNSETLTATVAPGNADNKTVSWKSSNTGIASVDNSGKVTAVKPGSATITVTTADGGKTATCAVTVTEKPTINVTGNTANVPAEGANVEFAIQYNTAYTVEVEQAAQGWLHSVETRAIQNGKLVFSVDANEGAARSGKATVKANDGSVETITLTFNQDAFIPVSTITLNAETLEIEVGDNFTLEATVAPENATDKTVEWSSSDTGIAAVEDGVITAVAPGTATVTAKAGEQTASCSVTVIPSIYETERAALEAFYKANNGDNWADHTNWCTDAPLEEWFGVQMDPDGKHVQALDLPNNNVQGFIPEEIADLTELESISINNEYYSGDGWPLPESIGSLEKLRALRLQTYTVGGTLPQSLFNLKNLEVLLINNAEGMTPGPLPAEIGNLTGLRELRLNNMNLTGEIPPEIGKLTNLTVLSMMGNKLSGSIPESFGNLVNLESLIMQGNQLSGDIPAAFYRVRNYWTLWPELVEDNQFTQENIRNAKIPVPRSPAIKMLSGKTLNLEEAFARNQYTVIINTGPEFDSWDIIPSLITLYEANKDKGFDIITCYDNNWMEEVDIKAHDDAFKEMLRSNNVPWDSFIRHMYDPDPAAISGEASPFYAKAGERMYPLGSVDEVVVIGPDQTVQYTTLVDHTMDKGQFQRFMEYISDVLGSPLVRYQSTDYSADGKVKTLQKATAGAGVDLVITGDAYSDRLIADGSFDKAALQAAEDFFSIEPFKSLRNRFNVYQVNAVSRNEEIFNGCSTVFSTQFVGATAVTGDNETALQYAAKAVPDSRMDDVVVLVLVNSALSGGTAYMMEPETDHYAGGASVTWVPYKNPAVKDGVSGKAMTLIHEAGGHGFGKLNDEYSINYYGRPDQRTIDYLKECHKKNVFVNVDVTDNPKEIIWSRYIADERFASESLGIYRGGAGYFDGIWRPSENSVMRTNSLNQYNFFNAPSRAQVYSRIMKLSEGQSWQFDYETFVKWDQAHPTRQSVAPATRANYVEIDASEDEGHVPPVIISRTWRQVLHGQ